MARGIKSATGNNRYYDILEERSIRPQNRVSPIIKTLEFDGNSAAATMIEAITYFKEKDGAVSKNAPPCFLEPHN